MGVDYRSNELTYSEFAFVVDALCERVYNTEGKLVLPDIQVFEAFVATKVWKERAERIFVSQHNIVFEGEGLELGQIRHFSSKLDHVLVCELSVCNGNLASTYLMIKKTHGQMSWCWRIDKAWAKRMNLRKSFAEVSAFLIFGLDSLV